MALVALLLALAYSPRMMQETAPTFRKLQAKMTIEYCSKNPSSELLPCKAEVFQQSLKGLGKDERQAKIMEAIRVIEEKRKKKIALAMHDDAKIIYDEFCATKKEASEICSNEELKNVLNKPLDLAQFKGRSYVEDTFL